MQLKIYPSDGMLIPETWVVVLHMMGVFTNSEEEDLPSQNNPSTGDKTMFQIINSIKVSTGLLANL